MAEKLKVRGIDEILKELFQTKDAALVKYAKVRHVQYEMNLWRQYGLPLSEVESGAKTYFQKRFLPKERISSASEAQLAEAFKSLDHAVKDGCHGRCVRLVVELNQALSELGLELVRNVDGFLNWLTFDYEVRTDDYGNAVRENPYGFEVRIFHDKENRYQFWSEAFGLLKEGRIMSMQNIVQIVLYRQRKSVKFK
ncbi:hypothetical protein IKF03_03035 [Candidatus Saccharibacteria bacterium]|nr:hypothetical protein [Candidatus Saccharibacteria bacterium]